MKRLIIGTSLAATLVLSGCGQAGIGANVGTPSVKQNFEIGKVVDQRKVMVDKGHLSAIGTGALVGGGVGALIGSTKGGKNALVGGLIGAAVGAGGGFAASVIGGGNEVEAYEIDIESNNRIYKTYVEYDLPLGTIIEFLVRNDGSITNIDVKRPGKRVN